MEQTAQHYAGASPAHGAVLPGDGWERTLTILVVEDDLAVAELLRAAINGTPGWGAIVVNNARSALEVLRYVPVDLLMLDVDLPGMSGPQLLDEFGRESKREVPPAIFMSAGGIQPAVERALRAGKVERFIAKPFDLDEIVGALRAATQARRRTTGSRTGLQVAPRYQAAAYRWGAA